MAGDETLEVVVGNILDDLQGTMGEVYWYLQSNPPVSGSSIETQLLETGTQWRGGQVPEEAMRTSTLSYAVGLDHLQSLALVLRQGDGNTFPIATLARGALESLARAWWTTEPESLATITKRYLDARIHELQGAAERGQRVYQRDNAGQIVDRDPAEIRAELLAILRAMGESHSMPPGYSTMTKKLMAASSIGDPDGVYSHLAAVSHGELPGVNTFLHEKPSDSPDGPVTAFEFRIAPHQLLGYLEWIIRCTTITTESMLERWGTPAEISSQWLACKADILTRVTALYSDTESLKPVETDLSADIQKSRG